MGEETNNRAIGSYDPIETPADEVCPSTYLIEQALMLLKVNQLVPLLRIGTFPVITSYN
jgi:hypothetical protein